MDQLIIRPITAQDATAFFRLVDADRAELSTYFPITTGRTTDPAACATYVKDMIAQSAANESFCYLVRREHNSDPIGVVFLKSFDRRVPKCEIAYFTASAHRGTGIASGGLAWAVDEAFRAQAMRKVFLRIDPENLASIRVAEKNAFEREGLLRQDFRTSDDRLLDVILFGKIR